VQQSHAEMELFVSMVLINFIVNARLVILVVYAKLILMNVAVVHVKTMDLVSMEEINFFVFVHKTSPAHVVK
jgi:hypothetical protein